MSRAKAGPGRSRTAAQPEPSLEKRSAPTATTTTFREAFRAALREALAADERVFLMGEDVGRYGGCFAVSQGLLAEFGEQRIRDTPLSESAFVGAGVGAALGGARTIVEIMTVNFSLLALDQILNNAATLRHMSGGQIEVPLVIRMATGGGRQLAAQHSHSLEVWYAHVPGLRVVAPATVEDARGMLWTALGDPNPVIIFEHALLYNLEAKGLVRSKWKTATPDTGRGGGARDRKYYSLTDRGRQRLTVETRQWTALTDPMVLEHRIGALMIIALAVLGYREARRGGEDRPLGRFLPALMIVGSLLLLGHAHSSFASFAALDTLINVQHAVLGGLGLTTDTLVERTFRELRAFRVYDGPSEVHRWSVGRKAVERAGARAERGSA